MMDRQNDMDRAFLQEIKGINKNLDLIRKEIYRFSNLFGAQLAHTAMMHALATVEQTEEQKAFTDKIIDSCQDKIARELKGGKDA